MTNSNLINVKDISKVVNFLQLIKNELRDALPAKTTIYKGSHLCSPGHYRFSSIEFSKNATSAP